MQPKWKRVIVKVGSSLLVDQQGQIRKDWLKTLVYDIAQWQSEGKDIAIVSSGAIALGARQLNLPAGGRASLEDAQAAAAIGQIKLSQTWSELLAAKSIHAAQILVTLDDLEDRKRYLNASATLERLIGLKVVPVINENDSVATEEIRFGDNDRLAARVAQSCAADCAILLSDVDGLFDMDPTQHSNATRIARVDKIDRKILSLAGSETSSGMGSGGMTSKLAAAKIAQAAGADLVIASGLFDHPLQRLETQDCGTIFVAERQNSARKVWLAGRMTVRGRIIIDAGANRALKKGASLLPAGAVNVEGRFSRGDVVDIASEAGETIARGLSEYDYSEAKTLCGKRSEDIEAILGYAPRAALVHRDHMVML